MDDKDTPLVLTENIVFVSYKPESEVTKMLLNFLENEIPSRIQNISSSPTQKDNNINNNKPQDAIKHINEQQETNNYRPREVIFKIPRNIQKDQQQKQESPQQNHQQSPQQQQRSSKEEEERLDSAKLEDYDTFEDFNIQKLLSKSTIASNETQSYPEIFETCSEKSLSELKNTESLQNYWEIKDEEMINLDFYSRYIAEKFSNQISAEVSRVVSAYFATTDPFDPPTKDVESDEISQNELPENLRFEVTNPNLRSGDQSKKILGKLSPYRIKFFLHRTF